MKQYFFIYLLVISTSLFAQKNCDYSTNVKDSLGTYKATQDYIVYEKNFAGNKNYIFLSLISTNGTPSLNVQFIQKSKEFMKANCFDKNSKIHFQLTNGKIVTLLHIDKLDCGTSVRDNEGYDNRVLTGTFLFLQGSIEELKSSTVSLMRIKFLANSEDYIFRKEFTSELNNKVYYPETYFIQNLNCILD